jgi:hypothetical protein
MIMSSRFSWITFDVADLLPPNWQRDVMSVAAEADVREFPRTPVLTREAAGVSHIKRGRVHAHQVLQGLPWLPELYRGQFLEFAKDASGDECVSTAKDTRYGIVLNVQRGTSMRFECHVDSNPLTGLLFFTSHCEGGELVIGQDASPQSIEDIEKSCSVIQPRAGHLAFIDGRMHPHYARPLCREDDTRVLAVMNYYTESCPESTRPPELNSHLYGDPLPPSAS